MAASPSYASTPRFERGVIATADSSRTSPTSSVSIISAAAAGTILERIIIQATATTTAGMVRLFVYDGSNYSLIKEVEVVAITPSATTPAFAVEIDMDGITLPNGRSIKASTEKSETFVVSAFGADLT